MNQSEQGRIHPCSHAGEQGPFEVTRAYGYEDRGQRPQQYKTRPIDQPTDPPTNTISCRGAPKFTLKCDVLTNQLTD